MKILILFIGVFFIEISLGQMAFQFPSGLKVNPYDSHFFPLLGAANFKMKRITQYRYFDRFTMDTLVPGKKDFHPEFVIDYDSLGRVFSMKYDFQLHLSKMKFVNGRLQIDSIELVTKQDSTHLLLFTIDSITRIYNYYENNLKYGSNELLQVEIVSPLRFGFRGVLDGVYVANKDPQEICTTFVRNTSEALIRTEIFKDGILDASTDYYYDSFEINGSTLTLLIKVVDTISSVVKEHLIIYEFY